MEGSGLAYAGLRFPDYHHPVADNRYDCPVLLQGQFISLMGLIAGGNTDPPALAYSNQASGNDAPSVRLLYGLSADDVPAHPRRTDDIAGNDVKSVQRSFRLLSIKSEEFYYNLR